MSKTVVNRVAEAIYQRRNPGRKFSEETALVQEGYRTDAAAALIAADALLPGDEVESDTCMNPACESKGTFKLQVFGHDIGLACDICAHFPDFDAADAALNAAMTEQTARLDAEGRIANVRTWLDRVLMEYDFEDGVYGGHSWLYSAGVLADTLRLVLDRRIGAYEPEIPEIETDDG